MRQSGNEESTVVTISGGKINKPEKLGSQRYREVVGEMIWRGVDRIKAEDNAKWVMKAAPGSETKILVENYPPVILKVR